MVTLRTRPLEPSSSNSSTGWSRANVQREHNRAKAGLLGGLGVPILNGNSDTWNAPLIDANEGEIALLSSTAEDPPMSGGRAINAVFTIPIRHHDIERLD